MPCLGQFGQHGRIGRWACAGSLDDRQIQLSEEYIPKLWIGVDVELHPRGFINLLLDCLSFRLKSLFQRGKQWEVDRDSGPFHLRQYVDKRYFHSVKKL